MIGQALFVLFAFTFAVVAFAPGTDVGKALRGALVAAPARLLNGGPLKVCVAILVFAALVVLAVGAPEWIALVGAADLSLYLDLAVLSLILGAVTGFRTAVDAAALAVRRTVRGRASGRAPLGQPRRRTPKAGKPRDPLADDDGWRPGSWALA